MLNCALIGSGFIGAVHGAAVAKIENCKLAAICDVNEEAGKKAAADFGCKFYANAEEMLDKEKIDFVQICLPTYLHEEYVLLAARLGGFAWWILNVTLLFGFYRRFTTADHMKNE